MWDKILRRKSASAEPATDDTVEDTPVDTGVAWTRDTGGVPDPDQPDQASTTGTTPNDKYVGRVAGQDVGYAGQTGAEARTEAGDAGPRQDP